MKGFFNNPQATAEVIRDGWLYTGDLGRIDEDGYLFLTGMKKNMIILKGQNIYPGDIEEVLSTHPKVAKAVVVGIPDKLRGETVGATIVLKEGETATEPEIRRFCQEQMADYKAPKHIIFTDSLPDYDTAKRFPCLGYPSSHEYRTPGEDDCRAKCKNQAFFHRCHLFGKGKSG